MNLPWGKSVLYIEFPRSGQMGLLLQVLIYLSFILIQTHTYEYIIIINNK